MMILNSVKVNTGYLILCVGQDDVRHRTRISNSTLCTGSSLSLSSGPTSGYNSGNTAQLQSCSRSHLTEQVWKRKSHIAIGLNEIFLFAFLSEAATRVTLLLVLSRSQGSKMRR